MKTTLVIILIMLIPFMFSSRDHLVIEGQVSDKETKDALINCHVYVQDRSAGAITDKYGNFKLKIPVEYKNKSLFISHIGYGKYERRISQIRDQQLKITLNPEPVLLDEITIRPEETGEESVLAAALDNEK